MLYWLELGLGLQLVLATENTEDEDGLETQN